MKKIPDWSLKFLPLLLLSACQSSQTMEKQTNKESLTCTKVVYSYSYSSEEEADTTDQQHTTKAERIIQSRSKRAMFISEIEKQHLEKDKTLWFDGKKSLTEQEDDDFGFWSKTTEIRDSSSWITIHKPLQYLHFWDRYEKPIPTNSEKPDDPTFRFTKKKKQILNYTCEQVVVESSSNKKICWFTKQLQLEDPTNELIQFDSVPGTILEIEEYWLGLNYWQYVRTTRVKSIEQVKVPFNFFEVPKTAQKMNSEQAANLNFKRLVEANKKKKQLSQEEKSKFLGIWALNIDGYGLQIEINDLGNNSYAFTQTDIEAGKLTLTKTEKASFYGSYLVLNECILYKLTADGKLQEEQNPFYTFTKSEDEKQLLLNALNYWVKGGGDPQHRSKNLKSTGESNSKVEDLKEKIAQKGLNIKWVNGKYEFIK